MNIFTEVYTCGGEQKILIQPTPEWNGSIEIYLSESDGSKCSPPFYLNKEEVETLYQQMKQMIEYINK